MTAREENHRRIDWGFVFGSSGCHWMGEGERISVWGNWAKLWISICNIRRVWQEGQGRSGGSSCLRTSDKANIHIPESVTIIGRLAFAECRSLSELSIPGSVQTLGDHAFRDCDSLERLFVDKGVLGIGVSAFIGCRSLTHIWISESLLWHVEDAFECDVLHNITLFRDSICGLMQRPFPIRFLSYFTHSEINHRWFVRSRTSLDESVQDVVCGAKK